MISKLKKIYIKMVEKYLMKCSFKMLDKQNINVDNLDNLTSIKNHIIDLNEKNVHKIDANKWFDSIKNQYRLNSSIIRYEMTKKIVEKYIDINKNKIIDFGAGNGVFLEFLKLNGTGIDINKNCVDHMRSIGIDALTLDELDDNFNESFNHAFAFEVIEHVENQLLVLNNIYEYIKKDGYIFVSIPYVKNSHVLKKQDKTTATKRLENYHIFELNTKDFKNLISHTKFELVEYEHLNPHKLSSNLFGKLLDKFYKADKPKWTIFILKKG